MVENMKGSSRIIICMVKEPILGQMGENIMVNTLMIKNMYILPFNQRVMEYMNGMMEGDMKENGNMENSMEKDSILLENLKGQENG